MKRLALFLLLLFLLPCAALSEVILFEDENGKIIMNDDGEIGFLPPDGSFVPSPTPPSAPTALPSDEIEPLLQADPPETPVPTAAPEPFAYSRKLEYGDSGPLVEKLQIGRAHV